ERRAAPDQGAYLGQLARVGGADHQQAVAARVPASRGELGHRLVQRAAADVEILQVARPGVGGAAQDDDAAVGVLQERLERIAAEVGIDRDRVGPVALEGLDGV